MESEFVPDPDVWEADEGIQNDADENARIYKLKKTLSPIREPKEHKLAPYQKGSYYVCVKYTDTKQSEPFVLCDPDTHKSKFQGFIPIAFLAELGPDEVDWEDVKQFKQSVETAVDPNMTHAETLAEFTHDRVAEKEFIDGWRDCWFIRKKPFPKTMKSECWIPTRDDKGRLNFRCQGPYREDLHAYKQDAAGFKTRWYKVLDSTWHRRSSPAQGKPPRWARVPLKNGLKVYFHTDKVPGIGQETLMDCIDGVNTVKNEEMESWKTQREDAINRLNSTGSDVEKRKRCTTEIAYIKKRLGEIWSIELVDQEPAEVGWFKLSTSPFGLYSTYISEKDWNLYMRGLAEDVPNQEYKLVPRPRIPSWTAQTIPKATNKVQEVYKKFLDATDNPQRSAVTIEATVGAVAAPMKPGHKYQHLVDLMEGDHFKSYKSGVRFVSTLNHPKIETASGKRDHEHQQKAIMNKTAGEVAEELGWHHVKNEDRNDRQMKNYLYTAEWLHLRAYSWGGHLDTQVYQGLTSQMPLNLVLGTSETNSVMLRYEKAWQNLFTFEHGLQTKLGRDPKPSGRLWIRTNPTAPSQDTSLTPQDMEMCNCADWGDIDFIETDHYDPGIGGFTIKEIPIDNSMRGLTTAYPWIAHSIAYHVSMDTHSYALDRDRIAMALKFYPFRRPFFHRAESLLDNLLFAELKKLGKKRAAKTLTNSAEDERKKKKILGKDYEELDQFPLKKQPKSTGNDGKGKTTQLDDQAAPVDLPLRQKKAGSKKKQQDGKDKPTSPPLLRKTPEEEDLSQPKKKTPADLNRFKAGNPAEKKEGNDSFEEEKTDSRERRVGGQNPVADTYPFQHWQQHQQYQHQQYQQQMQPNLAFYDYISRHKETPKKKDDGMKIEEEPQTGQGQQQPGALNPIIRQLGASQGGYLSNGVTVRALSLGTNQQLMGMSQEHIAMIGGFQQGRQNFINGSKNGKNVNRSDQSPGSR